MCLPAFVALAQVFLHINRYIFSGGRAPTEPGIRPNVMSPKKRTRSISAAHLTQRGERPFLSLRSHVFCSISSMSLSSSFSSSSSF